MRAVAARRSVAQASFNAIVAMKSSGTTDAMTKTVSKPSSTGTENVDLETKQTRKFMAAIMDQLLPADPSGKAGNIFDLIGYSPSYFSQLEILAKRMYRES